MEPRRKNVSCATKNASGIFDAPASLQHLVPLFAAKTCHLCSPRRRHGSALRRGVRGLASGVCAGCDRSLASSRRHVGCVRRDVVTALPCDGAFATESLLSGRLVGGPDGAWAGTGEGDRGGSRVALRSRRDSRLVRSCQLSRSKKKGPWGLGRKRAEKTAGGGYYVPGAWNWVLFSDFFPPSGFLFP